jgi:hypothetical protein
LGGVEAKRGAYPFAAAIGITNGQSGANAIKLFFSVFDEETE